MKALVLVVSEKKIFLCFSHCKSMADNDPRGGAIFDPRGIIGKIYVEDHYILLHTNMKALGLVVSEKKIFFYVFSHCKSMAAIDPRGGAIFDPRGMIGMIYIEDHYTLLHTKYESFGPCGFGEEFFFMFFL